MHARPGLSTNDMQSNLIVSTTAVSEFSCWKSSGCTRDKWRLTQPTVVKVMFRYSQIYLKCWGAWDTIPVGTKPRTLHHPLPGGERHRKRKRSTIFLEMMRKGHHQSDQHWNCFKGNIGGNSWQTGWSAYGPSWVHRYHLELYWTELNSDICDPYSMTSLRSTLYIQVLLNLNLMLDQ